MTHEPGDRSIPFQLSVIVKVVLTEVAFTLLLVIARKDTLPHAGVGGRRGGGYGPRGTQQVPGTLPHLRWGSSSQQLLLRGLTGVPLSFPLSNPTQFSLNST